MKDALIRIINDRKRRAIDCKNTNIVTPAAMIQYNEDALHDHPLLAEQGPEKTMEPAKNFCQWPYTWHRLLD